MPEVGVEIFVAFGHSNIWHMLLVPGKALLYLVCWSFFILIKNYHSTEMLHDSPF